MYQYKTADMNLISEAAFSEWKTTLNPERLSRILSKKTAGARKESLTAQFLLEELLKEKQIDPKSVHYSYLPSGKPFFDVPHLYFSLSHSGPYALAAISDVPIGCDIQVHRSVSPSILKTFASEEEIQAVKNDQMLFDLFSAKEAYIKCLGLTLKDIKNATFHFIDQKIICTDQNVKLFKEDAFECCSLFLCTLEK